MVSKGEEEEHRLYSRVKDAEYARQKQEQNVKRLQQKFSHTKTQNSQEMKKKLSDIIKQEKEMEQKILREQAQLDKVNQPIKSQLTVQVYVYSKI